MQNIIISIGVEIKIPEIVCSITGHPDSLFKHGATPPSSGRELGCNPRCGPLEGMANPLTRTGASQRFLPGPPLFRVAGQHSRKAVATPECVLVQAQKAYLQKTMTRTLSGFHRT